MSQPILLIIEVIKQISEPELKTLKSTDPPLQALWKSDLMDCLRDRLKISEQNLRAVNAFIVRENNPVVESLLNIIDEHGGIEEINRRAREAGKLDNTLNRLRKDDSPFLKDLEWLMKQRDSRSFISIPEYRKGILGKNADSMEFDESYAVTLEISACNYFHWLVEEARVALRKQSLMPSRYIRVRSMREQIDDNSISAFAAAAQIMGASYVETLDTKGTMPGQDGMPVNVHLGGPETITGYFGGVGMPNEHALEWVKEYLHYYTQYGVKQVLNVNSGTVMLGYWMYKLGIDLEFKISVFMGNDNPYSCLWTLMTAKLFSREDGTTPLVGFNLSNATDNRTIQAAADIRNSLGLEDKVRIEHHIFETYKSIVRQPYNRLGELLEIADHVKNLSAKHEGGDPETEKTRDHPSDILDYFIPKQDILAQDLMPKLLTNYLDKHESVNRTAKALTEQGSAFVAAKNLHAE